MSASNKHPRVRFIDRLFGRSDIMFAGTVYMKRWRLINTRWFGVRVHKIERSDADRDLHDHPFTFVSLILRGGYKEETVDGRVTYYPPGSVLVRSADNLHRVLLCTDFEKSGIFEHNHIEKVAWTLVFTGPIRRRWGFLVDGKWVDAKDVRSHQEARKNRENLGQVSNAYD